MCAYDTDIAPKRRKFVNKAKEAALKQARAEVKAIKPCVFLLKSGHRAYRVYLGDYFIDVGRFNDMEQIAEDVARVNALKLIKGKLHDGSKA
jgi:orotate phosphoribosyltransferase